MDDDTREAIAELKEALRDLKSARTPSETREAKADVKRARRDLREVVDELRDEGRNKEADDLENYLEEKAYASHKARTDRYFKERGVEFVDDDGDGEGGDEDDPEGDSEPEGKARPKRPPKKDAPVEKPPPSSHAYDRPLFGRKRSEG